MDVNPVYDPARQVWHVADAADTRWDMVQMITTWALTGTPAGRGPRGYLYCWHFPTMAGLIAAAEAWDPETMDEPLGYVKRKGERREAPRREDLPAYNRRRCAHGTYTADLTCPRVACEAWSELGVTADGRS